jgi:hypothetical protein
MTANAHGHHIARLLISWLKVRVLRGSPLIQADTASGQLARSCENRAPGAIFRG